RRTSIRDRAVLEPVDIAGLQMQHADQIGDNFVVSARVHGTAHISHGTAKTSKVLTKADVDTAGRQLVVVKRIVGQSIAQAGGQIGALLQFDANRQRSLSERKATCGSGRKYRVRNSCR